MRALIAKPDTLDLAVLLQDHVNDALLLLRRDIADAGRNLHGLFRADVIDIALGLLAFGNQHLAGAAANAAVAGNMALLARAMGEACI